MTNPQLRVTVVPGTTLVADAVKEAMLGEPVQPVGGAEDDAEDEEDETAPSVLIFAVSVGPNNAPFDARSRHCPACCPAAVGAPIDTGKSTVAPGGVCGTGYATAVAIASPAIKTN